MAGSLELGWVLELGFWSWILSWAFGLGSWAGVFWLRSLDWSFRFWFGDWRARFGILGWLLRARFSDGRGRLGFSGLALSASVLRTGVVGLGPRGWSFRSGAGRCPVGSAWLRGQDRAGSAGSRLDWTTGLRGRSRRGSAARRASSSWHGPRTANPSCRHRAGSAEFRAGPDGSRYKPGSGFGVPIEHQRWSRCRESGTGAGPGVGSPARARVPAASSGPRVRSDRRFRSQRQFRRRSQRHCWPSNGAGQHRLPTCPPFSAMTLARHPAPS